MVGEILEVGRMWRQIPE
jgi:hypothetical protein